MTFSRPKFNRKQPGKFGTGDFVSLDDIDKDGAEVNKKGSA